MKKENKNFYKGLVIGLVIVAVVAAIAAFIIKYVKTGEIDILPLGIIGLVLASSILVIRGSKSSE